MVQIAWEVPKDDDFVLKDFALNLLEMAQENLARDHQLVPVSFMVTADQLQCYSVTLQTRKRSLPPTLNSFRRPGKPTPLF